MKQEYIIADNSKGLIRSMMFFLYLGENAFSIYFLDLDQYSDDYNGLIDYTNDVAYFNAQKCNGNMGQNDNVVFYRFINGFLG